jgi:hypothetical protein
MEIQADNIANLLDEQRIGRQLVDDIRGRESFCPVNM